MANVLAEWNSAHQVCCDASSRLSSLKLQLTAMKHGDLGALSEMAGIRTASEAAIQWQADEVVTALSRCRASFVSLLLRLDSLSAELAASVTSIQANALHCADQQRLVSASAMDRCLQELCSHHAVLFAGSIAPAIDGLTAAASLEDENSSLTKLARLHDLLTGGVALNTAM